jgi:hypothetical protein
MNYAELNPTVTYSNAVPTNYNINDEYNSDIFEMYQEKLSSKQQTKYSCDDPVEGIKGIRIESSELSSKYFSDENMDRLQKKIKRQILENTGKKIIDQDKSDLLIVMRAVFSRYATHDSHHVVRQVKKLNIETVKYIVPDMITNLLQEESYLQTITNPIKPIDRPINVNSGGRNVLPSYTSLWF